MGKLNYVNRKSEGVKLGHIVAKDLRKRLKPPNGSSNGESSSKAEPHRDMSPLEIYLEGKVLTDEGFKEVAAGLEDVLCGEDCDNELKLQVLHISRNNLTIQSLSVLSKSLTAASEDLEDLDISGNQISVNTEEEGEAWESFLDSLRGCRRLKKFDLSGNNFGGIKCWEIFTRVFSRHFRSIVRNWSITDEGLEAIEDLEKEGIELGLGNLTIQSPTRSLSDLSPREEVESSLESHGLPSIGSILVNDANITDGGALFLSYAVEQHKWIQGKINRRGSTVSTASTSPSTSFSIWPNSALTPVGQKLLKLAEASGQDPQRSSPEKENIPGHSRREGSADESRRTSGSDSHSRKVSASSGSADYTPRRESHQSLSIADDLESTRKKVQRTILENDGVHSVELWSTTVKFLPFVRRILCEYHFPNEPPPAPRPTYRRLSSDHPQPIPSYADVLKEDPNFAAGSASTTEPFDFTRGTRRGSFSWQLNTNPSPSRPTKAWHVPTILARLKPDGWAPKLIGGLMEEGWEITLGHLVDPKGVLSERQRNNVMTWGKARGTLSTEMESLGKPRSVQIWKVLQATGCLAYETKALRDMD